VAPASVAAAEPTKQPTKAPTLPDDPPPVVPPVATPSSTATTAKPPVSAPLPRIVTPPPASNAPTTSAAPVVSESELVADAERTIRAFAVALSSRDSAQVRRAFPGISATQLQQWQSMYDATERVRVTVDDVQALDNVLVPTGASSRFRVRQSVAFTVAGSRRTQAQQAEYTAILRRNGGGWTLVGVSDR
jgi:eukaryotic-like serine/threonine-protein kinase